MKKIKYIKLIMLTLALGLSVTSCMDEDWSDPTGDTAPYGNNDIQETNVISIADLKPNMHQPWPTRTTRRA